MLEIILGPGIQLSLIAESANEAEILLKMGNVYIFKKRYHLIYIRSRPGIEGDRPMNITVYQFELIDSSNTIVPSFKNYDQFFLDLGGSKVNKRRKTKSKRKTKKRRTNKRKPNKKGTNKRRNNKRQTNKRRRI